MSIHERDRNIIEKAKRLDERHARQLLDLLNWLPGWESAPTPDRQPTGAMAMLGFARKFRTAPRTTAEWLNELRAGERE